MVSPFSVIREKLRQRKLEEADRKAEELRFFFFFDRIEL